LCHDSETWRIIPPFRLSSNWHTAAGPLWSITLQHSGIDPSWNQVTSTTKKSFLYLGVGAVMTSVSPRGADAAEQENGAADEQATRGDLEAQETVKEKEPIEDLYADIDINGAADGDKVSSKRAIGDDGKADRRSPGRDRDRKREKSTKSVKDRRRRCACLPSWGNSSGVDAGKPFMQRACAASFTPAPHLCG
jgi:hypothetical protein